MAESSQAWVTLATNDSYSLGAMVLAHSLRRVGTTRRLVVMITPGVTLSMQEQLRSVFDEVRMVDVLDSQDAVNLALLSRPDLGITFTKLHCWRLANYTKCVFLDADTLVLQPCDELFDREELSAAPDPGWPDIFNSGVFVYTPSETTYQALLSLALTTGSFDGGDQGLLNTYFSDWATRDINRHLPFLYNMCSPSFYSYLPAFKQFGEGVKIAHFIGPNKPWSQYFDSETRQVRPARGAEHLKYLLQFWWDLFCSHVHPHLKVDMSHRNLILPQLGPFTADSFYLPPSEPTQEPLPHLETYHEPPRYPLDHFSKPLKPIIPLDTLPEIPPYNPHHLSHSDPSSSNSQGNWDNNGNPPLVPEHSNNNPPHFEPPTHNPKSQSHDRSSHTDPPRHPSPTPSPGVQTPQLHMDDNKQQAGLASAFSQMTMGSPSPAATVEMQEHLRRAAWEQGNADYMGADAFDKIWSKIMDTVSQAPTASSSDSSDKK